MIDYYLFEQNFNIYAYFTAQKRARISPDGKNVNFVKYYDGNHNSLNFLCTVEIWKYLLISYFCNHLENGGCFHSRINLEMSRFLFIYFFKDWSRNCNVITN